MHDERVPVFENGHFLNGHPRQRPGRWRLLRHQDATHHNKQTRQLEGVMCDSHTPIERNPLRAVVRFWKKDRKKFVSAQN